MRAWTSIAASVLMVTAACGHQTVATTPSSTPQSSPCPGPAPLPNAQVTAVINLVPTSDPSSPDSSYALQVPSATELLVVIVQSNASSKNDLIPSFSGPNGQIVTRSQLVRDDITGGNPGDLGIIELMQVQSPGTGPWILRLHNTARTAIAATAKATAIFHLHRPPLAQLSASPALGPAPLTVVFDAAATQLDGGSASYCWNFTDGVTARGVKVSHTFGKPGIYDVELTVTDDQGRQGYSSARVTVRS